MGNARPNSRTDYFVPREIQAPITRLIARADRASGNALKVLWKQRLWSTAPRGRSDEILKMLFAWKLQARAFGGLDQLSKDRLVQIRHAVTGGKKLSPAIALRPGMVLVRHWHGVEHRVLVLDNGFEYGGRRFRTLSNISRIIAGPNYTGPHFFGIGRFRPTARTGKAK